VWRRLAAGFGALLLLAVWIGTAGAHDIDLFGHVSVDEKGEVTLRVVDVYGALVEGQQVTAYATGDGDRAAGEVTLTEGPAGTYRGVVPVPGDGEYRLTIDMFVGGDLHRLELPVAAGEAVPEQTLRMSWIDPPEGFTWKRLLFYSAGVLLVVTTWIALRRPRPAVEEG